MSDGHIAHQVALVSSLERYLRAEALAGWFPQVVCLGQEADRRHDQLVQAALLCGFEPGGKDSFTSTLEWSRKRVETICAVLPNNVADRRAA